jgi:rhodanese-related sulfurtransferase
MTLSDNPTQQTFHLDGVKHILPEAACKAVQDGKAYLLDVREANEWESERLDMADVLYHPLSMIMERLQHIPTDRTIIVLCVKGIRSTKVANLLNIQDFDSVANLDGGLEAWKRAGLPVVQSENKGCSCGCSCDSC